MLGVREFTLEKDANVRMTCEKIDDLLEKITAVTMSANRQCLAIACKFRNDKSARILFYDTSHAKGIKRMPKTIVEGSPTDNEAKFFVSIAFSPEAKQIAAITNLQDGNVKIYEWKKEPRIIAMNSWVTELKKEGKENENAEITKVTIDPVNKDQIMMSGKLHARMWRNQGGLLKPMPRISGLDQNKIFTDHVWVENNWIVLGTDKGELCFVYDGKQCIMKANAFGSVNEPVSCIYTYFRGLIIGGDNGQLSLWEKKDTLENTKKDLSADKDAILKSAFRYERNISIFQ